MKKLLIAALVTASAVASSAAFAAHYDVYPTRAACRAAAHAASDDARYAVGDCRLVDGGWTYERRVCQDNQCQND